MSGPCARSLEGAGILHSTTPSRQQLNIRLDQSDLARLKAAARRDERPPTALARLLIRRGLDQAERAPSK